MDPEWVHCSDSNFVYRPSNLRFNDNSSNTSEDTRDTEVVHPPTSGVDQNSAISTFTTVGPKSSGSVKRNRGLKMGVVPYAIDLIP